MFSKYYWCYIMTITIIIIFYCYCYYYVYWFCELLLPNVHRSRQLMTGWVKGRVGEIVEFAQLCGIELGVRQEASRVCFSSQSVGNPWCEKTNTTVRELLCVHMDNEYVLQSETRAIYIWSCSQHFFLFEKCCTTPAVVWNVSTVSTSWRIIPFGRGPHNPILRGLTITMIINHWTKSWGPILQVASIESI